jgi:hypothetical protein
MATILNKQLQAAVAAATLKPIVCGPKVHTVPTGTMATSFVPVPLPDLMEIIQTTCPGQDGISILYSLAGGLKLRAASLAAKLTNVMAAAVRMGDGNEFTAIDKFNDAISALDQAATRIWAFNAAGISQRDMIADLEDLIGFMNTVDLRIAQLTKKARPANWAEAIEMASNPRAVEEWKLVDGWNSYVAACNAKDGKLYMTEEEHRAMDTLQLSGKKQDWSKYKTQILGTIEQIDNGSFSFHDISEELQMSLLTSISSVEKQAKFDLNARKFANGPQDLDTRRRFLESFFKAARLALTHPRYNKANLTNEEDGPPAMVTAGRSDDRRRQTASQQAEQNQDAFEYSED